MGKSKLVRLEEMKVMLHVLTARAYGASDEASWTRIAAVAGQIQRGAKVLAEHAKMDAEIAEGNRQYELHLDSVLEANTTKDDDKCR